MLLHIIGICNDHKQEDFMIADQYAQMKSQIVLNSEQVDVKNPSNDRRKTPVFCPLPIKLRRKWMLQKLQVLNKV